MGDHYMYHIVGCTGEGAKEHVFLASYRLLMVLALGTRIEDDRDQNREECCHQCHSFVYIPIQNLLPQGNAFFINKGKQYKVCQVYYF